MYSTGLPWLDCLIGLVVLTFGAEWLVRGAARLAISVGISALVVGLTVVAYGTSTPELVVSLTSSLEGKSDVALGNVVGSNIFNVLFILGACAVIAPLVVDIKLVRWEVPLVTALSALVWWAAQDGWISRLEGGILLGGLIAYTFWTVRASHKETKAVAQEFEEGLNDHKKHSLGMDVVLIAAGLVALVVGSKLFVNGSIEIAKLFGVSDLVISLTLVAAGTSMPEVATSIMATIRGQRDIAVGNVIGSNLFNLMGVLGAASIASPVHVAPQALLLDLPIMIAAALACWPIFASGRRIDRREGALLFAGYVIYTLVLIRASQGTPATMQLSIGISAALVIPPTLFWLATRKRPSLAA
jgi:cation:H+ antiporter